MSITFFQLSGLAILFLIFSNCASVTGFQDGRTIGKNNIEFSGSINFARSPRLANFYGDVFDDLEKIFWPNIEVGGQYGVLENLDVKFKSNISGNLDAGAKYQFYGSKESPVALAIGADIGTIGFLTLWNLQLPAYLSFHPSEQFTLYLSPRYIYQFSSYTGALYDINYLGFNAGFLYGKRNKFGFDLGYYNLSNGNTSAGIDIFQFGFAGRFLLFKK